MSEQPKASSELSQNLALDELKDESKRQQVEAYFHEKKAEIGDVSKGRRKEMQDVMREMNRMKAGPDKIIEAILRRLFSESTKSKFRTSYPDKFADLLIEFNINLAGDDDTKEELNANTVFKKARGKVLGSIEADITKVQQAKGKYLKPQYIDMFAEAAMRRYMKSMDEDVWGRVSESNVDEDLKIMTFQEWRQSNISYSDETLFLSFNPEEARRFVGDMAKVKTELSKITPKKAGMDKAFIDFFQKESTRIESDAMASQDAAIAALEEAQKLGKSFASALTIVKQKKDVEAKLNESKNLKDKLPDFDVSIEEGYKKFIKNIDAVIAAFIAKKGAGELMVQTKTLDDLNKKLTGEKERAAKGAAVQQEEEKKKEAEEKVKENEPPSPVDNPDEWLAHMGKEMGPFGGILVAFLAGSPLFGKFKKFIGKFKKKKDALEQAPRIVKIQGLLRKKFHFKGEEALALTDMKISDVLKASKSPSKVRQKPFKAFQEGLKTNGATKGTAGTVLEFIEKKQKDWKETNDDTTKNVA